MKHLLVICWIAFIGFLCFLAGFSAGQNQTWICADGTEPYTVSSTHHWCASLGYIKANLNSMLGFQMNPPQPKATNCITPIGEVNGISVCDIAECKLGGLVPFQGGVWCPYHPLFGEPQLQAATSTDWPPPFSWISNDGKKICVAWTDNLGAHSSCPPATSTLPLVISKCAREYDTYSTSLGKKTFLGSSTEPKGLPLCQPTTQAENKWQNLNPVLETCVKDQIKKYGKWIITCQLPKDSPTQQICHGVMFGDNFCGGYITMSTPQVRNATYTLDIACALFGCDYFASPADGAAYYWSKDCGAGKVRLLNPPENYYYTYYADKADGCKKVLSLFSIEIKLTPPVKTWSCPTNSGQGGAPNQTLTTTPNQRPEDLGYTNCQLIK